MRCKSCKELFEQYEFNNKFCKKIDCQTAKALFKLSLIKKQESKDWKERKKVIKDNLQTVQELTKVAQVVFNRFIRERDAGQLCISCQKPPKKENAGHFVASGKSKFLSFNEDNVHLQCEYCNTYLHSNAIEYRINLIKKIGIDKVEWLERNRNAVRKYTREDLNEIIKKYKTKLK
jgi:hypothetical protein